MLQEKKYADTLDQYLLRAYIALEKIESPKNPSVQFAITDLNVKTLKLIYACLHLCPKYVKDILKEKEEDD